MITINVNQESQQVAVESSLHELLATLEITPQGIAVAINQDIVPKSKWEETKLKESDDVLIIKATQGG